MSKSSLKKDRRKLIKTNQVNGWSDFRAVSAGVVETGVSIIQLPTKAEMHLTHIVMYGEVNSAITGSQTNAYGVTISNDSGLPVKTLLEMMETTIVIMNQRIDFATAVGIFNAGVEIADDLDLTITRATNLPSVFESNIVPWYRTSLNINISTRGLLRYELTLFQDILKDPGGEWNGYTWEESAS